MKATYYVTTKILPGGIKIGTGVKFINGQWVFDGGQVCIYNPEKEPDFFKVEYETYFKPGDVVYITEKFAKSHRGLSVKHRGLSVKVPATVLTAQSVTETRAKYTIEINKVSYTVTDKDIYDGKIYFFISSKGIIQHMVTTETHINEFAYHYRKATGNYFENKEDAQLKINEIKNKMAKGI
jgi:hypothetical protein